MVRGTCAATNAPLDLGTSEGVDGLLAAGVPEDGLAATSAAALAEADSEGASASAEGVGTSEFVTNC